MKKIVSITCAALIAAVGMASTCDVQPEGEPSCQIWFNGASSGKISTGVADQSYKTVKPLYATKVQLVLTEDGSNVSASVVLTGKKKGVESFTKTLECSEFKWNVFGKSIDSNKKNVLLDSEMFFQASDEEGTTVVSGVLFGQVRAKTTGSSCGPCGVNTISTKYIPGTFRGGYVGCAPATGCACARELTAATNEGTCSDSNCLTFVETDEDKMEYFYGNVSLKYDSKNSGYKIR